MMRRRWISLAAAAPLVLAACSGGSPEEGGGATSGAAGEAAGEINYALWDANQLPAYQQCADEFTKKNPAIKVTIKQQGWDDYWSGITTGLVSGTAPDVFTDHLSKYTDFFQKRQLLALDEYITRDSVPTDIYQEGLAELWVGDDGKRYGLPQDWDTIGIFYNKKAADDAGLTAEQMSSLTWNPSDGGTYEQAIAKLTVDKSGKRGDEAGFDKNNVETYGLWLGGSGGGFGQTQWSMYAYANGWTATNKNPWGNEYNYDDPKFQETITWWKGLIDKGYMPTLKASTGVDGLAQLAAGKAAMATEGDWNANSVVKNKSATFEPAFAPTPVGPTGKRASMFNGLSNAIYAGTKNKEAAWQWVKYLASAECQNMVGSKGIVFPAIPEATEKAVAAFEANGLNVDAFTVHVEEGTTFLPWITSNAADITAIMQPAMDAVLGGSAPVSSLTQANEQVNALFK